MIRIMTPTTTMPYTHAGWHAPAWDSTPSTTHAKASSDTSNATPTPASSMSKREQSPAPSSQDMMDDVDISTTPPSPPHTGTKASAPHSSTPHCMRSRTKASSKSHPRRLLTQRCRQRLLGAPRLHCARRSDLPQQSPVLHHSHRHMKTHRSAWRPRNLATHEHRRTRHQASLTKCIL